MCLLASDDEIDTSNAPERSELPSHLKFLQEGLVVNNTEISKNDHSNQTHRQNCDGKLCFVLCASCVSALGGVLFGYDVGNVASRFYDTVS